MVKASMIAKKIKNFVFGDVSGTFLVTANVTA